jgi:hypothetical protein
MRSHRLLSAVLVVMLSVLCVLGVGVVSAGAVSGYAEVPPPFGSFVLAVGVAVDNSGGGSAGDVYEADPRGGAVDKFNAFGEPVAFSALGGSSRLTAAAAGVESFSPWAVAVDSSGDLYVTDETHGVVFEFEPSGKLLRSFSPPAEATPGGPFKPSGITVDTSGNASDPSDGDVYVSDHGSNVVDKFTPSGGYIPGGQLGGGGQAGLLVTPDTLAVDPDGDVYVTSRFANVRKFSPTGQSLGVFSENRGQSVATDPSTGNIFVKEGQDSAPFVQEYDQTGIPITQIGNGIGFSAYGIAVGASSTHPLYVSDINRNVIRKFELGEAPETPVTEPASEITPGSALLHGELNPGTATDRLTYYFLYGVGDACTGGSTSSEEKTEGNHVKVQSTVTGLEPSSHYTFCLIAKSPFGTVEGPPESFTTPASAPVIDGQGASGITPFAATLEAQVNPEKQDTTCVFEYGPTNSYGTSVPCTPEDLGSGFGDQQATTNLTGLTPGNTYHYRTIVKNATGTTEGQDQELTALEAFAPVIDSQNASASGNPTLTLEAQINPDYQETTYSFQYAGNEALTGATTVPGGTLPAVFGDQPASVNLSSGLTPGVYYYRAIAVNATGTSYGTVQSFTRVARPTVGETEAQDATTSTVVLSGSINPQGLATTYRFELVSETAYQAALAASAEDPYAAGPSTTTKSIGSDYTPHATGEVIAKELLPGTTYHYALVATNQQGTTIGADGTFTTGQPTPPGATTGSANNITQNTASITGTIDSQGLPTTYGFEIGLEAGNYGPPTGLGSVGAGAAQAEVILPLTGLQPGTTYHYRITATNNDGTSYGTDQSFTTGVFANAFVTPPAPLPFLVVPSIVFPAEAGAVVAKKVAKKTTKKKPKKPKKPKKRKKGGGHGKPVKRGKKK